MTAVVGLDLSLTATGIATPDGSVRTITAGNDADAPIEQRILDVYEVVLEVALASVSSGPLLWVIESPYISRKAETTVKIVGLNMFVRCRLQLNGNQFAMVTPSTLHKLATGKGQAKKVDMVIAARDRLGYDGTDDNEADALWLREAGLQHLRESTVTLPKAHLAALDKVVWP